MGLLLTEHIMEYNLVVLIITCMHVCMTPLTITKLRIICIQQYYLLMSNQFMLGVWKTRIANSE